MYIGLHVKYPLFLSDFNDTCIFSIDFRKIIIYQISYFLNRFSKNNHISNFMKIRPLGAEFFHADRRTDMTKLTDPFRNFAKAPKSPVPIEN